MAASRGPQATTRLSRVCTGSRPGRYRHKAAETGAAGQLERDRDRVMPKQDCGIPACGRNSMGSLRPRTNGQQAGILWRNTYLP